MTNILSITAGVLGLAVLAFAFSNSASLPDVHVSYSTDECVKVINYDKNDSYSCENMPSKFNHVWVQ